MYIKCTNTGTQSLKRPWMDEAIDFADTGTAQVPEEVGERLIEELNSIEHYETGE